jgi:hypothetical protein
MVSSARPIVPRGTFYHPKKADLHPLFSEPRLASLGIYL